MNKNQAINSIMNNFDFDRVQHTMEMLNWKWASSEDKIVPLKLIIIKAMDLLNNVVDLTQTNKTDCVCSTGGLRAEAYWDEEDQEIYNLKLSFVLTEWEEDVKYN